MKWFTRVSGYTVNHMDKEVKDSRTEVLSKGLSLMVWRRDKEFFDGQMVQAIPDTSTKVISKGKVFKLCQQESGMLEIFWRVGGGDKAS